MTAPPRWLLGAGLLASLLGGGAGCSNGTAAPGDDCDAAANLGDTGAQVADATPSTMCDAASLAPRVDGGAAACFVCQAAHCAPSIAACSVDCACAPAYTCLQENSISGSINTGYSACSDAVDALMNGNAALMDVAGCTTGSCHDECFGDGS